MVLILFDIGHRTPMRGNLLGTIGQYMHRFMRKVPAIRLDRDLRTCSEIASRSPRQAGVPFQIQSASAVLALTASLRVVILYSRRASVSLRNFSLSTAVSESQYRTACVGHARELQQRKNSLTTPAAPQSTCINPVNGRADVQIGTTCRFGERRSSRRLKLAK